MNTRIVALRTGLCLLFTLVMIACNDDSSTGDTEDQGTPSDASADGAADTTPDMPPATGSATIGAEGGAFSSIDGVVALTIPAGVVTDPTEFRIDPVEDASELPTGHTGPAYHLQPEGVVFDSPVVLTLDWSALDVSDEEGAVLRLATVMEGQWVTVAAGWNDPETGRLSAHIPHFSYWAALPAPGTNADFNPCLCPSLEALQQCAREVPVLSFADGSSIGAWAWRTSNSDCGLGGHNQTNWYRVYDCIEEYTASHNPFDDTPTGLHTYGGCTRAERDCCEAAILRDGDNRHWDGGFLGWDGQDCYCSPVLHESVAGSREEAERRASEIRQTLSVCLAAARDCGGDQTSCERYRSGSNPISCGAACVDLWSDPEHCGGCGNACESGVLCIDGECSGLCDEEQPWLRPCHGACVDLQFNRQNCGQCGWSCADDEACEDGECVPDDYECEDGPRPCDPGQDGLFCCRGGGCDVPTHFPPTRMEGDTPPPYPGPSGFSCHCPLGGGIYTCEWR